jgi:hypothetical protein
MDDEKKRRTHIATLHRPLSTHLGCGEFHFHLGGVPFWNRFFVPFAAHLNYRQYGNCV